MFQKKLKSWFFWCLCSGILILCGCKASEPVPDSDGSKPVSVTTEPVITEPDAAPTPSVPEDTSDVPAHASYVVQTDASSLDASHNISKNLFGIFLEDINFAVDGGMYAELVKNRSFEYGGIAGNLHKHGWSSSSVDTVSFEIVNGLEDGSCLNSNNPCYAVLSNTTDAYGGIFNRGYLDGMAITLGEEYRFSVYLKAAEGTSPAVRISIVNSRDEVYASETITGLTGDWYKYELTLTPSFEGTADGTVISKDIRLLLEVAGGSVCADMVSLMTTDTYKGTNIRRDIGEALEALHPSFMRFPGGCVIEGKDLESMYSWKDSIGNGMSFCINGELTVGDVATRPQGRSVWTGNSTHPYYTTYGIGFYEFFELCEKLDCMPVPVLNAGMTCQIQSQRYLVFDTNSEEFKQRLQDALDLAEFCLGDASTYWGSVRIAMGHEEPFPLKYIAIGNEQWQTEYYQHYKLFEKAFLEAAKEQPEIYGGIELIVANSTGSGDTVGWDYVESRAEENTTLVDEHYYEYPDFFFTNTKRYDSYDRSSQAKVFLGEYAAKSNTLEAALAEAAYMTGLEKNGDIVELACYAPLFGNSTSNQWTPDLIWFNNHSVYGSVNYYVQQLFSVHRGSISLPASLNTESLEATVAPLSGKVGLGTWQTSAAYDNLVVTDNVTGEVLYSCTFDDESVLNNDGFKEHEGSFSVQDGRLIQTHTGNPADTNTGDVIYVGDLSWSNYTLTVDATILSGAEGFLIPVCVKNSNNNIFWNLGGWGNTVSCLQIVDAGIKSGQVSGTVRQIKLKHNQTYQLKIVVNENNIQCFLDGIKYIDYTKKTPEPLYESACLAENGDLVLKFINPSADALPIDIVLQDFDTGKFETTAQVITLSGKLLTAYNSAQTPDHIVPEETTMNIDSSFTYEAPAYSLTVLRIPAK
ncbi:MAG: alpha-L-arabinofuranosidase C-terminal domain-containing protein [Lachnospiraceae bacterium]